MKLFNLVKYEYLKFRKKTIYILIVMLMFTLGFFSPFMAKANVEENYKMNEIIPTTEEIFMGVIENMYDDCYGIMGYYMTYIGLSIVVISAVIICEEFGKGTVKLLYVRPYRRELHYVSKLLCVLFIVAILSIIFGITSYISTLFIFKTNNFSIYNDLMEKEMYISVGKIFCESILLHIPDILIYVSIFFIFEYITSNTVVAIIFNFISFLLLSGMGTLWKGFPILSLTFVRFWNFVRFIFGCENNADDNTILKSIIVCAIYFVIFVLLGLKLEKNQEIKNE